MVRGMDYHVGCGIVEIEIVQEEDGSNWEICSRCGETIKEVNQ